MNWKERFIDCDDEFYLDQEGDLCVDRYGVTNIMIEKKNLNNFAQWLNQRLEKQ